MIQSIERAVDILNAVARKGDWVGVREIARMVDLKPPTTQQLLKTLQSKSLLEFDEDRKQYRIGLGIVLLSETCDRINSLANFVKPYMNSIFEEYGETVGTLVWHNDNALVIDWKESEHSLTVTAPSTNKILKNSHHMASFRMLLAWQNESTQNSYLENIDFKKQGEKQPQSKKEFLKLLTQIRTLGYSETDNVLNNGIAAVAAPIFTASGKIVLALACSAPIIRMNEEIKNRLRNHLVETAREMTKKLS